MAENIQNTKCRYTFNIIKYFKSIDNSKIEFEIDTPSEVFLFSELQWELRVKKFHLFTPREGKLDQLVEKPDFEKKCVHGLSDCKNLNSFQIFTNLQKIDLQALEKCNSSKLTKISNNLAYRTCSNYLFSVKSTWLHFDPITETFKVILIFPEPLRNKWVMLHIILRGNEPMHIENAFLNIMKRKPLEPFQFFKSQTLLKKIFNYESSVTQIPIRITFGKKQT